MQSRNEDPMIFAHRFIRSVDCARGLAQDQIGFSRTNLEGTSMRSLTVFAVLMALAPVASAQFPRTFDAEVLSVSDGDTIRVRESNGDVHRLRFNAVDAPEVDQPFGNESTDFVRGMVEGKTVTVMAEGEDDFGRLIANIEVDGKNVNQELLKAGLAWWFYHFSDEQELAELEAEAKAMRRGLFMSETPIYPRNWRRGARVGGGGGGGHVLEVNSAVVIVALLPNPSGPDLGNETVILANQSSDARTLNGWTLVDDDGGSFSLDGVSIPAHGSRTITLDSNLQLGNGGDELTLRAPGGDEVQTVDYDSAENGRFVVP